MKRLIVLFALIASTASAADNTAVFTAPPQHVPTNMMPDGPLLGNGDVGVVLAGPPELQRLYIGKNDFWRRDSPRVVTVGRLELSIPALQGATYRQEQDMNLAEVRGTFTKGELTVHTRSWVDADENLLLTQVRCDGAPITFSVRQSGGASPSVPTRVDDTGTLNIGREQYGGGRWYFDGEIADVNVTNTMLSGEVGAQPQKPEKFDGKTTWHTLTAPKVDQSVSVAAWIKIADAKAEANYIVSKGEWNHSYSLGLSNGRLRWAINGTVVQSDQQLAKNRWLYVVGTFDGKRMCVFVNGILRGSIGQMDDATSGFTRKVDYTPGGREVAVVTRILGADTLDATLKSGDTATIATAILSDLDAKDCLPAAQKLVADLTVPQIDTLTTQHRAWWKQFWSRSFIEIPDKVIERHWYAALYVMGSCSRPGKVAPGLWGNWVTTDHPAWCGDFHLNYNFQAPFYIVYGSNHADLSLPMYTAMNEFLPKARQMAEMRGWKGAHFPVSIGPWGISTSGWEDLGQRSDGAYAALNFIWYWQYTHDDAWLKESGYPFLREVAEFWVNYLKYEDGRYVDINDAIQEMHSPSDVNPILTLGLLRTLFKNLIPMSQTLGVDADQRAKWRDILDKLSPFTTQQHDGKTVFRYTEKGTAWFGSNTLGIQHIFPAGAIDLDSDPKLLEISRNTIDAMNRWSDANGFSSWYTACARVGYDPKVILAKLRHECDTHSMPNLLLSYGGGGIENVSGLLAVNEMLMQSDDGVIRLFPDWPKDQDARFGTLRAVRAFLVSAQMKEGVVGGVKIVSEKGCDCTVANPWSGRSAQVIRNGQRAEVVSGERFILKTKPAEILELHPQ